MSERRQCSFPSGASSRTIIANSQSYFQRAWNGPKILILAIFLSLAVATFNVAVVFLKIEINRSERFHGNHQTLYTTGIAVFATGLSYFITSALRSQWLRLISHSLARHGDEDALEKLELSWRANLGLTSLKERIFLVSSWPIQLLYLATALLTAAIVAATTPALSTKPLAYLTRIPSGASNQCSSNYTLSINEGYTWKEENRTISAFSFPKARCPAGDIRGAIGSVNIENPDAFVYSSNGVAVEASAIGAPESLYSMFNGFRTGLEDAESIPGSSLVSVEQCAPVLLSNPVSCRRGGKIAIIPRRKLSVSIGSCVYTTENTMVGGMCITRQNKVGSGSIAIGANFENAAKLALWAGDLAWADQEVHKEKLRPDKPNQWLWNVNYSVICNVDTKAAFGWRNIKLVLRHHNTARNPYRQYLIGESQCTPKKGVDEAFFALATAGLTEPIAQLNHTQADFFALAQKNADTNNPFTYHVSSLARTQGWAFNDSTNGLEDALGIIIGITMSMISPFTGPMASEALSIGPLINLTGTQTISIYRVGSGSKFALTYAIPPIMTFVYAVWLLIREPSEPVEFKVTRMRNLISFGQRLGKSE